MAHGGFSSSLNALCFSSAIRDELTKRGLQCVPLHIDKILQLFDTFNVRFGVVITGPTTAGKTTAYKVLANAMSALREAGHESDTFQHVEINVLNPKYERFPEIAIPNTRYSRVDLP
jgi:dynein heavy chain